MNEVSSKACTPRRHSQVRVAWGRWHHLRFPQVLATAVLPRRLYRTFASDADAGSDRWFETTPRKNRINFLELLRGNRTDYVLSNEALIYMEKHSFPKHLWYPLTLSINRVFKDQEEWLTYLKQLGIEKAHHLKTATEGALLGVVISSGVSPHLGIMSDGAGQFRLLEHGLCWVHALASD